MELFRIEHLDFTYQGESAKVLDDISFSVHSGEIITLCGASGCGKSTLLKHLKSVLSPFGKREGQIFYKGRLLSELDEREETEKIGFVSQSADNQIVTDKVYHELAFGLESLSYDNEKIRQRVAEISSFFGIQNWFYRNVNGLSGGQKQILTLASVMTMLPEVIILDEPTSQLDPIAASEFINMLLKINRDLGVTIIITEHRLDEIIPFSNRVIVMEEGRILTDGAPEKVCLELRKRKHTMFLSMPITVRIWNGVNNAGDKCPLTVNAGRLWLESYANQFWKNEEADKAGDEVGKSEILNIQDIWFKYEKGGNDILKGVSLCVNKGEILGLLGGNGTGKSTLLSVISGLRKPYRGKVNAAAGIGMLPQNPKNLFVKKTVLEDLKEVCNIENKKRLEEVIIQCRLELLLNRNPYDLSGGEQQRAAIAKVLLCSPDILLLDEPTKGMDNEYKNELGKLLKEMAENGITIIMVSHDIEFCAEWTKRCALFFDGNIISQKTTREFFINNSFYTTTANRMARNVFRNAVLPQDVIDGCNHRKNERNQDENNQNEKNQNEKNQDNRNQYERNKGKRSEEKKSQEERTQEVRSQEGRTQEVRSQEKGKKEGKTGETEKKHTDDKRVEKTCTERKYAGKHFFVAAVMILIAIPFTVFAGIYFLDDRKYLFISLLILFESMLPFFILYERKNPGARQLVMMSVICAICVAGRMAFYMLPEFKPVIALVILSGVSLGAETGFLVGATTMLTSNIVFGQGPWTPWQMFAMGIIGFLSGLLFQRKAQVFYKKSIKGRVLLSIFGFLVSVIIYGGIMNPAAAVMSHAKINKATLMSYYLTGLPIDIVQGIATCIFLFLLTKPVLEKIERVKQKYGMGLSH